MALSLRYSNNAINVLMIGVFVLANICRDDRKGLADSRRWFIWQCSKTI